MEVGTPKEETKDRTKSREEKERHEEGMSTPDFISETGVKRSQDSWPIQAQMEPSESEFRDQEPKHKESLSSNQVDKRKARSIKKRGRKF